MLKFDGGHVLQKSCTPPAFIRSNLVETTGLSVGYLYFFTSGLLVGHLHVLISSND